MMTTDIQRARQMHISDIIHRSSQRFKSKIALVENDIRISYEQLNQLVHNLSVHLHQMGLKKGQKILIFSHNCWQFPVILHAAAKIGVITVPINFMLNSKEVKYILQHSQPEMVIVEDSLCEIMQQALNEIYQHNIEKIILNLDTSLRMEDWLDFNYLLKDINIELPPIELLSTDPVRMMYTSGTESLPKGVLLNSESLMWQYASCIIEGQMSSEDREIHAFPLYHCAQLDAFLNVDLLLGATSYIFRRFDPELVLATIEKEKINKLFCPPTAWIALLNAKNINEVDLSSLKKAYYGASTMPITVIEQLLNKLPHIQFWQLYGQTEMSPVATVLHPEEHKLYPDSVGRPALYVETQIMDADGHILKHGEVGEIVHRSIHLTLGYDQNPEKTVESFQNGWFHSGDLGYINADGFLYVIDRIKDMVKTGGENVSTREVEDAIYHLDGIKEVAVFAVPHPKWIEVVSSVIVLHEGVQLNEKDVIEHCRQHLSAYKVPKLVFFYDALPKNASGKILKRELKQNHQSHVWL